MIVHDIAHRKNRAGSATSFSIVPVFFEHKHTKTAEEYLLSHMGWDLKNRICMRKEHSRFSVMCKLYNHGSIQISKLLRKEKRSEG